MTDRALPAVRVGTRTRPDTDSGPRPAAATRPAVIERPVAARHDALLTAPARAGMLLGTSAAVYAVTLAGISILQSQQDAATAVARAPYSATLAEVRAANDALETRLRDAGAAVGGLMEDYDTLTTDVAAYQARLDELAALVSEVQGSAAALPDRIRLPDVSVAGPIAGSGRSGGGSAPRTSGRSGGSGG